MLLTIAIAWIVLDIVVFVVLLARPPRHLRRAEAGSKPVRATQPPRPVAAAAPTRTRSRLPARRDIRRVRG